MTLCSKTGRVTSLGVGLTLASPTHLILVKRLRGEREIVSLYIYITRKHKRESGETGAFFYGKQVPWFASAIIYFIVHLE